MPLYEHVYLARQDLSAQIGYAVSRGESRGDGRERLILCRNTGLAHPDNPIGELIRHIGDDLLRQPGFADPTWADDCQQATLWIAETTPQLI